MYHPAAALRSTDVLNAFKQDFYHLKDLFLVPPEPKVAQSAQPSLF
jgi:hypothetical protein